jgi:hypothetical protein
MVERTLENAYPRAVPPMNAATPTAHDLLSGRNELLVFMVQETQAVSNNFSLMERGCPFQGILLLFCGTFKQGIFRFSKSIAPQLGSSLAV